MRKGPASVIDVLDFNGTLAALLENEAAYRAVIDQVYVWPDAPDSAEFSATESAELSALMMDAFFNTQAASGDLTDARLREKPQYARSDPAKRREVGKEFADTVSQLLCTLIVLDREIEASGARFGTFPFDPVFVEQARMDRALASARVVMHADPIKAREHLTDAIRHALLLGNLMLLDTRALLAELYDRRIKKFSPVPSSE